MTPMMMISGVFFPADQLAAPLVAIAKALPLYHGVQIVRPLIAGAPPADLWLHVAVLLAYAAAGYAAAIHFARRRFALTMLSVKSFHIIFMVTWFAGCSICRASSFITPPRRTASHLRALQGHGTAPLLGHHDAGRRADHPLRRLALARLVRGATGWLHAKIALVAVLAAYHVVLAARRPSPPRETRKASAGIAGSTNSRRSCSSRRCSSLSLSPSSVLATAPRGLEPLLAQELTALGAREAKVVPGGGAFMGTKRATASTGRASRRAPLKIADFSYGGEEDVYDAVKRIDWPRYFRVERTLRVNVTAQKSPLRSLEFATLRVKDAVCDRFRDALGKRPDEERASPDVRVHVFETERATLYLDTSGEPLFKRGWRTARAKRRCAKTSAGIIMLTGWRPGEPLLDPMCGGATLSSRPRPWRAAGRRARNAASASKSSPRSTRRPGKR